jgi:hypothetical protein
VLSLDDQVSKVRVPTLSSRPGTVGAQVLHGYILFCAEVLHTGTAQSILATILFNRSLEQDWQEDMFSSFLLLAKASFGWAMMGKCAIMPFGYH